ncbi:MAG TPA: FkbM family methyltransferase [Verrucomicrobiae bacterium]
MSTLFKKIFLTSRQVWFEQRKKGLRERIFNRYGTSSDTEVQAVIQFLQKHPQRELPTGMTPPYDWTQEYEPESVVVERDTASGLLFVMEKGQRVFFPRKSTPEEVQQAVAIGRMEQDPRSPHCYLGNGFNVDKGDTAVFIGASDGLFCLSLIDRLAKAYLFEPNSDWHEPLRLTFAQWGDKVEVVPAAAASSDSAGRVSLDHFFQNRPLPNYIQIDVDGAELDVLNGARNLLTNATKLRWSICTYHKRLDFPDFEKLLAGYGYAIGHAPNYFLIGVRMPYLRRGILYASRGASMPAAARA